MLVSIYNDKNKLKEIIDVNYHKKGKLIVENSPSVVPNTQNIIEEILSVKTDSISFEKIKKLLSWEYEHKNATKIKSKMSVTDIVGASSPRPQNELEVLAEKPKFLIDRLKLSNAEIGTITHYVLSNLDLQNKEYTKELIKELLINMVEKEKLTENQVTAVNIDAIYNFTKSNLANRIKNAKQVYSETGFYTYVSIEGESILVQGIIDCYFIEQNGNVVLLDYKTDYVQTSETELIDKYKEQLTLYKKALEESLKISIKEVFIYSTYLNKEICLQIM